jgi:transcriptional regulator
MTAKPNNELLPGTLEMIILATLRRESLHGYAIAKKIQENSGDLLRAEEGSLYPALQRLLIEGRVSAAWGVSARNRRVRIYKLTPTGRQQLDQEMKSMGRMIEGLNRIMRLAES